MALIIKTDKPNGLLTAIRKGIDDKTIETWSYDDDGDFTHTPAQWKKKAWLRPKIFEGELRFGIIKPKGEEPNRTIYGVYHGRFIEMLLIHFFLKFTTAIATSQKTDIDTF
jgi:hypothetical protein